MINSTLAILFPVLMAFAAAYDLLTMRIPNWITLALIAGFLVVAMIIGMPLAQIGIHFAVGAGVLVVAFTLFALKIIGGGDAKAAAGIGLWMGVSNIAGFLLYSAIFGGVLTVLLLGYRHFVPAVMLPNWTWVTRLHDKTKGVPYGIALAFGAMVVYTNTAIYQSLMQLS